MPFYYTLDGNDPKDRRTVEGLLRLKAGLDQAGIPARSTDNTLLLATWNIREFESGKYGQRGQEPLFYMAEIISRFDLVAVQEVRDDLSSLNRLMRLLGGWWKCILTDMTKGAPGNRERLAFLYDTRKIDFGGLAGEIVLPAEKKVEGKGYDPANQLARTPYLAGFRAGWFRFTLCTTHIIYGEAMAVTPEREGEIRALARSLAEEATSKHAWSKNMILLGDFNIFSPADVTFKAITEEGFHIPAQIQKLPSNVPQNKHYDQIAFIAPDMQDKLELCKAGVFNFFRYVYRSLREGETDDEALYAEEMGKAYAEKPTPEKKKTYYREWRTFQMSDHLPMWIELQIDFSKQYLEKKLAAQTPPHTERDPVTDSPVP